MQKNTLLSIIAIVIIIGGGAWIYKNNTLRSEVTENTHQDTDSDNDGDSHIDQTAAPSNTATVENKKIPGSGIEEANGVKSFVVKGNNFSFAPSVITVKKGDKVKITLDNTGGFHDLKIDEFGVATKKIQGDQQDSIEFVADKAGSFEYYCSVGSHRQMGMKGTLIVE